MGFSANQLRALRRDVDRRNLRSRTLQNGRSLTYIEGWHAVAEANRIFGFECWDRETLETRCILAREIKGSFTAIYVARVRITVRAESQTIIREGHGTGEGKGSLPGEAHDMAIKTAETDATKRALATFGKPFGLSLYLTIRRRRLEKARPPVDTATNSTHGSEAIDSTIPPHYATGKPDFVRRRTLQRLGPNGRYHVPPRTAPTSDAFHTNVAAPTANPNTAEKQIDHEIAASSNPTSTPRESDESNSSPGKTDAEVIRKALTDETAFLIAHPRRIRDKDHLAFVSTQPCLLCGRTPSDAHHLKYTQPRAMSRKVSDEFTVPLCRTHHRQLHQSGDESAWWNDLGIDPLPIAQELWQQSRNPKRQAESPADTERVPPALTNGVMASKPSR